MSEAHQRAPKQLADPTRLWVCTDHDGHYPVGVASIVMANSVEEAKLLMDQALREQGLSPHKAYSLLELNISVPFARVLCNGDY